MTLLFPPPENIVIILLQTGNFTIQKGGYVPHSAIDYLILRKPKCLHIYNFSVNVNSLQYIDKA